MNKSGKPGQKAAAPLQTATKDGGSGQTRVLPKWNRLWDHFELPALILAFLFCLLCLSEFYQNIKWLIVVCCVLSAAMAGFGFWKGRFRKSFSLPVLAVTLYYLIVAVSVCWTSAGKFFLREYSKLLFVLPLFLFVVLYLPKSKKAVRNLLLVVCSVSAVFAALGTDVASKALTWPLVGNLLGNDLASVRNSWGMRLPGIFANANISGGVHGLAILLNYGLFGEENRKFQNGWAAFLCSIQIYMFVLGVNRSAIAFFCLAVLIAWVVSGENRMRLAAHILCSAVPTAVFAFFSSRFFPTQETEVTGIRLLFPLAFMLISGGVCAFLEVVYSAYFAKKERKRKKKIPLQFVAVLCVVAGFAIAAVLINGPLKVPGGGNMRRACYPAEGTYSLEIEADHETNVVIRSQNYEQAATGKSTTLYSGPAEEAVFSVDEDCRVVYFFFRPTTDCVITWAQISGAEGQYRIHLGYPLLPDELSNRLVGMWASKNLVERALFFRDGMKIWKDYPVLGAGLGAFESLIAGYQEFRYVTRYVHNHYIQVLVDNGVVGLASFLFLLVSCFLCILRGRKEDDPFHWLFAPLLGAFVMLVLHSFMDVIMSTTAYLPFAYALFGICARCWGKPLSKKWLAAAGQIACALLSLTYAVLISLNIRANSIVAKASSNSVRFFSALKSAVRMDAFEYTDWKVSYLINSEQMQAPEYKALADRYAGELLDVPSNSLHTYLVSYYLAYRNYDLALTAAQNGAHFNYADAETWNHYFNDFENAAMSWPEDTEALYRITLELSDSFDAEIARMFNPISLSDESLEWIEEAKGNLSA